MRIHEYGTAFALWTDWSKSPQYLPFTKDQHESTLQSIAFPSTVLTVSLVYRGVAIASYHVSEGEALPTWQRCKEKVENYKKKYKL